MPRFQTRDIGLHYEASGIGRPLLFIHGLGSSARDWEFQVPAFSENYRVVTLDLRGHGQSDKPPGPYSMSLFSSDIAALLRGLGIESAHVVGLSLGGCVAFQLALDAPALVKTMVVVNSAPELVVRSLQERLAVWQRRAIVRLLGMRRMGEVLSKRLLPKPEQAQLRATFVERWAENDPRAYLCAMRAMIGWSVKDKLGSIRCPSLLVSADQDYTPLAREEEYAKLLPDARLVVIPDAHHAAPIEQPERFNAALAGFLAEHS